MNHVKLSGVLVERLPLRYTPAGVPVLDCQLKHESVQTEAGYPRKLTMEVSLKAMGPQALQLGGVPLGIALEASGFLAARSGKSSFLLLHVTEVEFKEGN